MNNFRFSPALAFFLILLLSSCGGGSGSSGGSFGDSQYSIDLNVSSLSFTHVPNTASPATQTVSAAFDGDGLLVGYPPNETIPSWLNINEANPGDTSSPVDIEFSINTSGLALGNYQTTVRFLTGDINGESGTYKDINVSLDVINQLGVSSNSVEISYINSPAVNPPEQSIDITGDAINWTASASETWVILDSSSGTAPSTLGIDINPTSLAVGEYSATISVSDVANSNSETITLTVIVEPHKLFIGDNGVGLADFPTATSRLSHDVLVSDNAGASISWSSSSNQTWLTVTSSGVTGDDLTMTADPSALAVDSIHYAEVSVTSSAATITNTETIQVGLYVAGNDPVATDMAVDGRYLASDPIRPYVYITNLDSDIKIYQIYSGALVDTVTVGSTLKDMTVSTDGSMLYVIDNATDSIVPFDLDTRVPGTAWLGDGYDHIHASLDYMRINGHSLVLTSNGEVFDTQSGNVLADYIFTSFVQTINAPTLDGKSFYSLRPGVSGFLDLTRYEVIYSDVQDSLVVNQSHFLNRQFGNSRDIAANHDGSKIYTASGGEYEFPTFLFDGNAITEGTVLAGESYPNVVELGPTEVLYGGMDFSGIDVRSYSSDDSTGPTYSLTGSLEDRQLKISGDGLRMLTLTETGAPTYSYQLNFTSVDP